MGVPLPNVPWLHSDISKFFRPSSTALLIYLHRETEVEFSTRLVKNAEDLIIKEGPETIGAFIAEPVMVAVRVIPPPVQAVVCSMISCSLLLNEYTIKPDLLSLAKAPSPAHMPMEPFL
ncbi:hypothetical protein DY000_02002552 [Brassica cretica]|uniref:Uncharacterized protein n=1 Tax=Brassica cretica TaxID=69181 RepID=A0ABQ7BZ10_BRACR|nr:hypothetical protein DY000_02002552 [Brassica cretica]